MTTTTAAQPTRTPATRTASNSTKSHVRAAAALPTPLDYSDRINDDDAKNRNGGGGGGNDDDDDVDDDYDNDSVGGGGGERAIGIAPLVEATLETNVLQ